MGKQSFRQGTGDSTYKSSVEVKPAAFGAQSLNAATEAKYPKGVRANFSSSEVTLAQKSSVTIDINTLKQALYVAPASTVAANFAYNNYTYRPAVTIDINSKR